MEKSIQLKTAEQLQQELNQLTGKSHNDKNEPDLDPPITDAERKAHVEYVARDERAYRPEQQTTLRQYVHVRRVFAKLGVAAHPAFNYLVPDPADRLPESKTSF